MTRAGLPDLERLVADLKGDIFARWMHRAQKQALRDWRDATTAPGLAARFTEAAETFYGFGQRDGSYWRRKGSLPDFVKTGRTRDLLLAMEPRSPTSGGSDVITRIRIAAGHIFDLVDVHGITGTERIESRVTVSIAAYSYQRRGSSISVGASSQQRTVQITRFVRGGASFAAEFLRVDRDRPWISERVRHHFDAIVHKLAVTKGGRLRSAVLEGND